MVHKVAEKALSGPKKTYYGKPWAASSGPRLMLNQYLKKGSLTKKGLAKRLVSEFGMEYKYAVRFLNVHLYRLRCTGVIIMQAGLRGKYRIIAYGIQLPGEEPVKREQGKTETICPPNPKKLPKKPKPITVDQRYETYKKKRLTLIREGD